MCLLITSFLSFLRLDRPYSEHPCIWLTPASSSWPSLMLQVGRMKASTLHIRVTGDLCGKAFVLPDFTRWKSFLLSWKRNSPNTISHSFLLHFQTYFLLDWLLPVPLSSSTCQTKSSWEELLKFYVKPGGSATPLQKQRAPAFSWPISQSL